jgi:hypothetical protein
MREKVKTITGKMLPESLRNFRKAVAESDGKKQYEIIHEASEDILKKISEKIKKQTKSKS